MAQEATVPEMDKLLAETDHFMLRQSHVWDIAAYVYQKAGPSGNLLEEPRILFAMRLLGDDRSRTAGALLRIR